MERWFNNVEEARLCRVIERTRVQHRTYLSGNIGDVHMMYTSPDHPLMHKVRRPNWYVINSFLEMR